MRRHVTLLTTVVLCAAVATCAKKPPAAGPPAGLPRPAPEFIAEAAPEPIATPGIWFAFDPDFIRNRYHSADLPFGSFTVSEEWRASAIPRRKCSGEDAEVHVGAYEDHLGLDDDRGSLFEPGARRTHRVGHCDRTAECYNYARK